MSQSESPLSNFSPFVVRTDNIAKELVSTASKYDVKVANFDFNLLDVQTFVKKGDAEETELVGDEIKELEDESLLADGSVQIHQTYEIEVVLADKNSPFSKLNMSIGANPLMTRLYGTIKPGSVIEYFDGIETELRNFINKRKLRANMLIGIWEDKLSEEISTLVAKVRVNGTLEVTEKTTLEVGCALEGEETVDDKLIIHYKKEEHTCNLELKIK